MNCLCFKREPCPIHKDKPLPKVDEYEDTMFIIRIHGKWVEEHTLHYYSTISKEGVRFFTSETKPTRCEALELAKEKL